RAPGAASPGARYERRRPDERRPELRARHRAPADRLGRPRAAHPRPRRAQPRERPGLPLLQDDPAGAAVTRLLAHGDRRVRDDRGVALLRLRLDQDLLALAPPGDVVGLAREGDAREARLVARDLRDVAAEDAVDHRLAHDPVRAEAVEDRAVE